jgi:hypothetical protein
MNNLYEEWQKLLSIWGLQSNKCTKVFERGFVMRKVQLEVFDICMPFVLLLLKVVQCVFVVGCSLLISS